MSVAGSYVDNVRSVVTCVHDCAQGGGGGRPRRGARLLRGALATDKVQSNVGATLAPVLSGGEVGTLKRAPNSCSPALRGDLFCRSSDSLSCGAL